MEVRFFEMGPNGEDIWEGYAVICNIEISQAIVRCQPPKYHTVEITEPVGVFVQLRALSAGATSEAVPFQYLPLDSVSETGNQLQPTALWF